MARIPVRTKDSSRQDIPAGNVRQSCDSDQACDRARFEVIVIVNNLAKSLFFCGHHFRRNRLTIAERGYEVKEIT